MSRSSLAVPQHPTASGGDGSASVVVGGGSSAFMLWTNDALIADIVSKPLKPTAHPDPSTRRQMASLREELVKDLAAKRDTMVHTILEEESRARVAAAVSAGLRGSDLAGSPFALGISHQGSPTVGPYSPRVSLATPLVPTVPLKPGTVRRSHSHQMPTGTHGATELPTGFDAELLLKQQQRPRRGFAVPKLTDPQRPMSSTDPASSAPQSPRRVGPTTTTGSGGVQSPVPPASGFHSSPASAILAPSVPAGNHSSNSGTSLPEELLQLMRQFRSAVDVLNAKSDGSPELSTLSLRAADVSRYIANFVVRREAERVAEEEERLRGWMRPRIATPEDHALAALGHHSPGAMSSESSPPFDAAPVDPITALFGHLTRGVQPPTAASGGGVTKPIAQGHRNNSVVTVEGAGSLLTSQTEGAGSRSAIGGGLLSPSQASLQGSVARKKTVQLSAPPLSMATSSIGRAHSSQHHSAKEVPSLTPAPDGTRVLCCAAMLSIHMVLDAVVHLAQCDRAALFLIDEAAHELASVALVGASAVARPIRVPVTHGVAGVVYRTGVSVNIPNTDKAPPGLFSRETQDRTGYFTRSILCCPVRVTAARSDQPDRVIGVVQLLNKLRPSAVAGFSPRDEDLLLKTGQVIGAILGSAGDDVSFTGLLAQEEGVRAQMVTHSVRHLAAAHRGDAGARTTTNAGIDNVTLTEARAMHKQQLAQEARISGSASAETAAVIAKGLPDNVSKLLHDLELRDTGAVSLIYRVPGANTSSSSGAAGGNSPHSSSADVAALSGAPSSSNLATLQSESIVNLVAFLQRIEQSWRDTRDQCMRHEATIAQLTEARSRDQSIRVRLTRLCREAGLITAAGSDVDPDAVGGDGAIQEALSTQQALMAEVEEFARDDEATFHARLGERQSALVENFDAHQASRTAKQRLRLAAAASTFDEEAARHRASVSARRFLDLDSLERAAMTPPRRLPLAPELERDKRNREFKEKREGFVRQELKGLVAKQRSELEAMLTRQKAETIALYQRLLLENREAEALLDSIFKEAGGLHPRRHQVLNELEERLGAAATATPE